MFGRHRSWAELGPGQRLVVVGLAAVQVALAAAAWTDLARRPPAQVNGRKGTWAVVIALNFVGPLLYFRRGRRLPGAVASATALTIEP